MSYERPQSSSELFSNPKNFISIKIVSNFNFREKNFNFRTQINSWFMFKLKFSASLSVTTQFTSSPKDSSHFLLFDLKNFVVFFFSKNGFCYANKHREMRCNDPTASRHLALSLQGEAHLKPDKDFYCFFFEQEKSEFWAILRLFMTLEFCCANKQSEKKFLMSIPGSCLLFKYTTI